MFVNSELQPKVSIITVCYNSAKTIEQTIISVLQQSYSNIEYIIIDGGSTDDTVNIIKKYGQKLAYWISEKDSGITDAWNKGIARATGEIVGIINSDDWYEVDAVEKAVSELCANPMAGFSFGNVAFVDSQNNVCWVTVGDVENYNKTLVYDMVSIPHPSVFVRRNVYERYGYFDARYRIAMDYDFLRRITSKGVKGVWVDSVLAYMKLGGISHTSIVQTNWEVMLISAKYGYNFGRAFFRFFRKSASAWKKRLFG